MKIKILFVVLLLLLFLININGETTTTDSIVSSTLIGSENERITRSENSLATDSMNSSGNSSEAEDEITTISSLSVLLFLIILLAGVILVHFISELNLHFIPESICVIIYGVIIGVIALRFSDSIVHSISRFDPKSFFLFILPVIIFETGFSLPKYDFFHNFHIIMVLAVIGTLISFLLTAVGVWVVGHIGVSKELPWFESLLIGAISCATDPVATLAIFKALDADTTLYIIVLGESILNDAISLILFDSVLEYTVSEIWKPFLFFFVVLFGSILIGIALSLILSFFLKIINVKKYPALETIYMLAFSYISYLVADTIGLSGILCCFFSGMAQSQYGYPLLSDGTKSTVTQFLRTYGFIGEVVVFIYIGVTLPQHDFALSVPLILWTFLFLLVSRAISIFPTFFLFNKMKWTDISYPIQIVCWFSGLRGAISFALSLQPDYDISQYHDTIQTTILIIVYLTIFIFGLGTYPLLKTFGIKSDNHDHTLEQIHEPYKTSKLNYTFLKKIDMFLKAFFNGNQKSSETQPNPNDGSANSDQHSSTSSFGDPNETSIELSEIHPNNDISSPLVENHIK